MVRLQKFPVLFLTFTVFGAKHNPRKLKHNSRVLKHNCSSAPPDEVTCHNTYIKNDLRSADELEFPEKSIFFVETSCKGGLDSRQACSIESAARAHPLWQVNVLFAGPVYAKCRKKMPFSILSRYSNVKFFRIHPLELAKDTPLEDFLAMNPLASSYWPVTHASDILRYLILYVWSGIYLDLDIIVLKPFDRLARNWASKEKASRRSFGVGSGFLAFSSNELGREVAAMAVEELKADFRGWMWSHNGPGVIYRALRHFCSTKDPTKMSAKKCNGFEVYESSKFNPVHYYEAKRLFKEGQLDLGSAYTCHVWSTSMSGNMSVHRHSPYATLAASHCPRVHARYGHSFGL